MDRAQIGRGGYTDLNQVLNAMPGVEVKKSGSGVGAQISIRGSGGSGSILILIDGRAANTTQYGGGDLDSIPLDMVERVDVFKPPVPVWLGPGGTAGAINIVLVSETEVIEKEQKNSRIAKPGGSFGMAGGSASHLMAIKEHRFRITAGAKHRDGRRTNSDRDGGNLSVQWGLPDGGKTACDVNVRYFKSDHGSPGPTYHPTPDARQIYQRGALDIRAKGTCRDALDYELKPYLDISRLEDTSQSGFLSTLNACSHGVKNETRWGADDDRLTHKGRFADPREGAGQRPANRPLISMGRFRSISQTQVKTACLLTDDAAPAIYEL